MIMEMGEKLGRELGQSLRGGLGVSPLQFLEIKPSKLGRRRCY